MKLVSLSLPRTWVGVGSMVFAMLTTPSPVNSASYPSAASELPPARGGHVADEIGGDSNKQSESDDPELIGSADAQLVVNPKALQGSRLRLRLPDGRSVTALRDHSNSGHPNTFSWVGHLEGEPLSRVIFGSATESVGGSSVETMAGSVDRTAYVPGDRWHLLPSGRGPYTFKLGTIDDFTCTTGTIPRNSRGRAGTAAVSILHGTAASDFTAGQTPPTVIDLLVVYSPAARVRYTLSGLSAMVVQAIADANTSLNDSYAHTFIKLVGLQEVAHVESSSVDINTVLGRLVVPGDGFLDTVPALRDQYGADVVTLVSEDIGASGVAYIPFLQGTFHQEYAFNVVNDNALIGGALTHELGHSLGCNHDRDHLNGVGQAVASYAFGFQSCGIDALGFRDIMAYECLTGGTSQRLNYFSSPWLSYLGRPLGVDYAVDPAKACDNARSIRETAPTIASFRSSVQTLPLGLSGLTASAPAFNQVALTWSTPDATTAGVELQRSADSGLTWSSVASRAGAATRWTDRPLTASTSYSYRVRAFNSAGYGPFSGVAVTTTPGNTAVPVAATSLIGQEVTESRIDLSWVDSANNEDGYRVERSDNGGDYVVLATLGWDATGYNDGVGLQLGHSYSYRVVAFNAIGDSAATLVTVSIANLPGSPTNLSLVPLTTTSLQISWQDNANNETGFILEKSTDGINFLTLATRNVNVTTFTNVGLVSGTTYTYRVWAQNISGISPTAASANVTWGQVPTAPSGLATTAVVAGQINLSWTDTSTNETSFSIERAGSDGLFSVIATVVANVKAFTDTSVASATPYSYRLRAFNPFGNSAYTSSISITSQPVVVTIPVAPTGLTATAIGQTQVNLSWNDRSNNETGFLVERAAGAGVFIALTTTAANITAYADATTAAATSYTYRVSAVNSGGVSAPSPSLTVTTLPLAPSAPSALAAATASSTQVNLSWADNANNETGFSVERATGAGTFSILVALAANTTAYQDPTAVAGTLYSYRLRGTNSGGNSAYSAEVSVTTPAGPLAAPSNLAASVASQTRINLSWQDNTANETGFRIERASGSGAFATLTTTGANALSYADSSVTAATTYSYRVQAINSSGYSGYSSTVTVTTPSGSVSATPPSAPSGLVATATSAGQLKLTWLDNSTNETGFKLEYLSGKTWVQLATLAANTTAINVRGLSSKATYSFRVSAYNATGTSAATNVSITMP